MQASIRAPRRLEGTVRVPGDKSISHRALILNSIALGEAVIDNLSPGADVASTASCLRQLGVAVEGGRVGGVGLAGLRPADLPLQCGNSGTTMRLLAGLLAGRPFSTTLVGDTSLGRRPMERVVEPLLLMGAAAATRPLSVGGRGALRGIEYDMPVASAQVKSALLLAGLQATGMTIVHEPAPTRDHTELMLAAMGARLTRSGLDVSLLPGRPLEPLSMSVPGDLSAAAFWLIAASLHANAEVRLPGVGVNRTRSAILDLMDRAGLRVGRERLRLAGQEPVADLIARTSLSGRAFTTGGAETARLIDELPILAVAAAVLPGVTRIAGGAELRVKESDRIAAMAAGLSAMGADIREEPDGWTISGPRQLEGAAVDSFGDHRVAMALAVAGLLADGETEIAGAECVDISYPEFWNQLERLCQ